MIYILVTPVFHLRKSDDNLFILYYRLNEWMFDVQVVNEGGTFIARCPELETEAAGRTREEAVEILTMITEKKIRDNLTNYRFLT